jgi:glutamyl-tRNA(Gln) amidotransferase subunit E
MMIATVANEVKRQEKDLEVGKSAGSVRNALPNGETEFLRPLPGKDRMYPETDLELLKIGREQLNRLKKNLPKLKSDIRAELKKKGLSDDLIELVLSEPEYLDSFTTLVQVHEKDAPLVAKMVTLWRSELMIKYKRKSEDISERDMENILELVKSKKIEASDVKGIMTKIIQGISFEEASRIEKVDHNFLEEEIRKIIAEKPGLRPNAYMGLVMAKLKGKIDAQKAMELIQKLVE